MESGSFKICNQCGGIDGNHASGCGGNPIIINSPRYSPPTPPAPLGAGTASKPPATTVGETPRTERIYMSDKDEATVLTALRKINDLPDAPEDAQNEAAKEDAYKLAVKDWGGSDRSMFERGVEYGEIDCAFRLQAAQLQIDRLKAEMATRYTVEEIRQIARSSEGAGCTESFLEVLANQRKESTDGKAG